MKTYKDIVHFKKAQIKKEKKKKKKTHFKSEIHVLVSCIKVTISEREKRGERKEKGKGERRGRGTDVLWVQNTPLACLEPSQNYKRHGKGGGRKKTEENAIEKDDRGKI